jgi:hypothetical protein
VSSTAHDSLLMRGTVSKHYPFSVSFPVWETKTKLQVAPSLVAQNTHLHPLLLIICQELRTKLCCNTACSNFLLRSPSKLHNLSNGVCELKACLATVLGKRNLAPPPHLLSLTQSQQSGNFPIQLHTIFWHKF